MELIEAIKGRRSIRKYTSRAVDDKTLNTILEAARQAPSWANTQCWRFILVRDSKIKDRLADTLMRLPDRLNPSAEAVKKTSVTIVACAETKRSGYSFREPKEPVTDKGDWYMYDVALAMQNLTLAAHALGLGTVHIGAFDAVKAAEVLGVPEGYAVVTMTPLGYPDESPKARPRKELNEIVFYDKFGGEQG
ncbi:NADPH-flavin oxidoreductase [subsurface metagenome]